MGMKRAVIRFPPDIIWALDQLLARVRKANPGRRASRAGVVRAIVDGQIAAAQSLTGGDFDALAQRALTYDSKSTADVRRKPVE
jgi:hypothetical protein